MNMAEDYFLPKICSDETDPYYHVWAEKMLHKWRMLGYLRKLVPHIPHEIWMERFRNLNNSKRMKIEREIEDASQKVLILIRPPRTQEIGDEVADFDDEVDEDHEFVEEIRTLDERRNRD